MMEKYYQNLLKVKSRVVNNRKPNTEYLSCHTVREVHKLLRSAFNQAVKWELMTKNPCVNATLPQEEHKARDIWDAPTLFKALELCDDDILRLAINLAFSCSLRVGEMLGLTWDCVEISDASIANGTAFIFVNKELQRVNRDALEKLNEKGIILKFPAFFARTNTALVLKEPKTKTSTRKVFLPKTVAEMLKERYQEIQEYKELFGDEFQDFNLVFCNANGRPMESQIITRALQKLIKENDLPPVVFHSLRHSSITYKLKLNGGDIKSVQGDSGHAQVKMVTDVYSHIIDEDRRLNAQRFEETFYQKKNPSEVNGATVEPKKEPQGITEEAMLSGVVFCIAPYSLYQDNNNGLAIAIWVLLAIYGIGCEIISGLCPLNENRQDEDLLTKIHGGASAIGFMTLLVVPLLMSILQYQIMQIALGTVSLVFFLLAFVFFCFFIMGEKEKFANTVLKYGGLWQRLVLVCCYIPLLVWCV